MHLGDFTWFNFRKLNPLPIEFYTKLDIFDWT